MSSMFIRVNISSSTTRACRPESNLFITSTARRRNVDRADHAIPPIVEIHRAFQLVGQTAFDHPRAEAFSGRWRHRRAVLLLPAQDEPGALWPRLNRPGEQD